MRLKEIGLALVVVVTVWLGVMAVRSTSADPPPSTRPATTIPVEPKDDPVVLIVGDSFVGGSLMNTGSEWPALMQGGREWIVVTDSVGGSGFINGDVEDKDYPSRVEFLSEKFRPNLVVVAGGINDAGKYPTDQIVRAAQETLDGLEVEYPDVDVVLFSPFTTSEIGPTTADLTAGLRALAKREDIPFIDVSGLFVGKPELIGSDTVHPTDAGHRHLADEIGELLDPIVGALT